MEPVATTNRLISSLFKMFPSIIFSGWRIWKQIYTAFILKIVFILPSVDFHD